MKHCPFGVVWERGAHFDICLVFVWVQPTLSYFTTVPCIPFLRSNGACWKPRALRVPDTRAFLLCPKLALARRCGSAQPWG